LVAVAVLVTAGSVLAQNEGGGGEGRGRGGRGGGFGRMGGGDRNSLLNLLQIKEVRDELKVTEDQDPKIGEVREAVRNTPRPEGLPDFRTIRDLPEEEQQAALAKMQEFNASREKEAKTKLAAVLDENQMKRLRGLAVQRMGDLEALNTADIAAEVKLNDEQKAQLKEQRDEQRKAMFTGFGGGRGEGNAPPAGGEGGGNFRERMQELRKASNEKAVGVLNDEQKTAYAAIKGDEFKFPPPQFGGGGGGGLNRGEGGDRPSSGPQREAQ
jgi:hypothetical protein